MSERAPALPSLPPRSEASHKGDFGRALLIGGSRGMCGAVALAGLAALRAGAGLVTLATPKACLDTVAGFEPSYMTLPLPDDRRGCIGWRAAEVLQQRFTETPFTCVGCGPGLGRSFDLTRLVVWLYETSQTTLVVDADGLNALAEYRQRWPIAGGPRILTPHPGEFRRLLGAPRATAAELPAAELPAAARDFARRHALVLVLKGHRTLITDGARSAVNPSGNPGLATGGTGDVLTGVIAALVCQGLDPFQAAQLGVYLHGLAGDLAAADLGQQGMIASDLPRYVALAVRRCAAEPPAGDETLV